MFICICNLLSFSLCTFNFFFISAETTVYQPLIVNIYKEENITNTLPRTGTRRCSSSESSESDSSEEDFSEESDNAGGKSKSGNIYNSKLTPVKLPNSEQKRPNDVDINTVDNRKSSFCPRMKDDLVTGTSTANLSPEDIGLIAAMGDCLATGTGLWPRTNIEFRGAAFPIGGDATIDGLVTVPNILRVFIGDLNKLHGVSHGMGKREQLPEHQLNVAVSGATSKSMPEQANELVRRIKKMKVVETVNTWAMVIITIGTEEVCKKCSNPDTASLIQALDILNREIPRAFVILLGPTHVSLTNNPKINLFKTRCECLRNKTADFMENLTLLWTHSFDVIQRHMESTKRTTFNALTLPMLTLTSRNPNSLFVGNKPFLNRRGHNYAAKWLWNRLITGPEYNSTNAVLSQEAYFCPSLDCPYFRSIDNLKLCKTVTHEEAYRLREEEIAKRIGWNRFGSRIADLYVTTIIVVSISIVSVLLLGTFFYRRSKRGSKGRFDVLSPPVHSRKSTLRQQNDTTDRAADDRLLMDIVVEEEQLSRKSTSNSRSRSNGFAGDTSTSTP